MSSITLTKTETTLLTEAAAREDGLLILPETMKEVTFQRLIGKLLKHELIAAREEAGKTEHHLTPAGYRAVGLKPRRSGRVRGEAGTEQVPASASAKAPTSGTKRDLVLGLLGRGEGASLDELIAATGWLPHTTRAVLSRLRSGGQTVVKSTREDGRTAYRVVADEPKPLRRAARTPPADPTEAVAG